MRSTTAMPNGSGSIPDYVCRVTADEGAIGGGHLSRFQELETVSPVILTTSQLLTTGVDAPTCKNVVIARVIGSMTDFKQIIGRGTRVREDYGKLFFNIVDYTGSATRLFADPDFDGEPALIDEEVIDEEGEVVEQTVVENESQGDEDGAVEIVLLEFTEQEPPAPRKFYFDGGSVEIAAQVVYELDGEGKQLRVVSYTDYARDKVQGAVPLARSSGERLAGTQAAAESFSMRWRSEGSTCSDSARSPACPTPIRSICCATWPSTGRCARGVSEQSACSQDAPGLLRAIRTRGARDPRGACRQVHRVRARSAPAARRAQGAAAVVARQSERDRAASSAGRQQLRAGGRRTAEAALCGVKREAEMARAKKPTQPATTAQRLRTVIKSAATSCARTRD